MIAFLNETILWWHWILLGLILLIVEMTTGTFIMLGLGISAILVGTIDTFIPLSFSIELIAWMVLSIISIIIWFQFFRQKPVSHSGQSNYKLDTLGIVTEDIQPHSRGKVKFDKPVLGNTSWPATAKLHIKENTRISIVEINGQLIEVTPISS